jgi:hypothetical protein
MPPLPLPATASPKSAPKLRITGTNGFGTSAAGSPRRVLDPAGVAAMDMAAQPRVGPKIASQAPSADWWRKICRRRSWDAMLPTRRSAAL